MPGIVPRICTVRMSMVRMSGKARKKLDIKKVALYAHDYEQGDEFPPIEVEDCKGFFTIRDGRHRYEAQRILKCTHIDVKVVR